jgi:enoyl-CoA hydratase/carnithine racemase
MATPATWKIDGGVAVITMDDGKANVIGPPMQEALHAGLDAAETEHCPVVLAGRDGVFSGGFDLNVLGAMDQHAAAMLNGGFELAHRMLSFPTPIVIACTGHAIAMGSFLLLSGDHRIGVAGAAHRIVANEVAIGMTLPWAAIEITRQRLTPAAFQQAMNLAATFDPDSAVAAGFLDAVITGDVVAAACAKAAALAELHRGAHAATKLRTRGATLEALRAAIKADDAEFRELAGIG